MILEGKTIAVVGVGAGLGREVVRVALRDGANVAMGARTESQLEAVARELDPGGKRIAWARTDISDAAQCSRLADLAASRFGRVDGLVCVAALDNAFGGLADSEPSQWRQVMDVNFVGTLQLVKAFVPGLGERGGAVVLIGSQSSMLPQLPQIAYASSKGALMTAMYFLAQELGPRRIRVNTVVPTWMWGPAVEGFVKGTAQQQGTTVEKVLEGITSRMAIHQMPADEDIAEACAFFCSERARLITGQALLVNAGEFFRA
jgi:NAD(P)-dependent dehydrogenase (short-subunit alcohol dehydrogenase family)